jgi:hypothetical protein
MGGVAATVEHENDVPQTLHQYDPDTKEFKLLNSEGV